MLQKKLDIFETSKKVKLHFDIKKVTWYHY